MLQLVREDVVLSLARRALLVCSASSHEGGNLLELFEENVGNAGFLLVHAVRTGCG